MASYPNTIREFLKTCRRRLVGLEAVAGVALTVSLVLATLLAGGLAQWGMGGGAVLRSVLLAGLLAGLGITAFRYVWRPWRRYRFDDQMAREVERRLVPDNSLELVSAVQLQTLRPLFAANREVSPDLVDAHLQRMAGQIAGLRPRKVFSRRRLRGPALLFFCVAGTFLLVSISAPKLVAAGVDLLLGEQVADPDVAVFDETPWIGDIRLAYHYPDYTGRQERVMEGTDGTIMALPGTRVSITSRADRRIAAASLKRKEGTLPMTVENQGTLSGELTVMRAGRYWFELEDTQGNRWTERRGHAISLEMDRAPRVELTRPAKDLEIQDQQALDLLYSAKDDFGLGEIRLVWRIIGRAGGEQRRVLNRYDAGTRKVSRRSFRWDLANLALEPGDRLQFFVEAVDNDTVLGPKVGRSATCNVKVFSADEHHTEVMGRALAVWEKLVGSLGDVLELAPEAGSVKETGMEAYRDLHKRTHELEMALIEINRELAEDKLVVPALADGFWQLQNRLQRLQSHLGMLLNRQTRGQEEREILVRALSAHRTHRTRRLEQDVLYLEDLLDMVRLEELDRLSRELDQARQRLAELMKQYAQAPSEEVRRQIEAEIARLKEKIAQLIARQQEMIKGIRDEYLNPDALAKMLTQQDMMGALDKVQRLMNEGKIDEAMAELERLQKQLQGLQAAIDRSRSQFGAGRYQELAQELARAQGELNMIEETQRQVMDMTRQIRDRMFEKQKKKGLAGIRKLFEQLRKRLGKVESKLEGIPEGWPDRFANRLREESLQQVRLLDMALESLDFSGSLESAGDLAELAGRLAREMELAARFEGKFDPKRREDLNKHHKVAKKAARESQEILEELKKVMPDPEKLLGKADRQRLQQLGRQQADLKSRMQALQQQMKRINEKAPIFGQESMARMMRGRDHMGRAASQLGQKRPGKAHPHQQGAMAELDALKKGMEKSCKNGGSGGMPLPMGSGWGRGGGPDSGGPGGTPQDRPVELPTPDDYTPPEAFRKALLEGMKDPVPEDFRQQVRRYYEELVK